MALGSRRRARRNTPAPKLQITAMMDMFTIIMIFLLVSFSSRPERMTLDSELDLPSSAARQDYTDSIRVTLTPSGLLVGEDRLAEVRGDTIEGLDEKHPEASPLYATLKAYRGEVDRAPVPPTAGADSAEVGTDPAAAPEEPAKHVLFFCDRRVPFKTINQVIKVAGSAGFPNLQFAVLEK